jgi:hypothetical protein
VKLADAPHLNVFSVDIVARQAVLVIGDGLQHVAIGSHIVRMDGIYIIAQVGRDSPLLSGSVSPIIQNPRISGHRNIHFGAAGRQRADEGNRPRPTPFASWHFLSGTVLDLAPKGDIGRGFALFYTSVIGAAFAPADEEGRLMLRFDRSSPCNDRST